MEHVDCELMNKFFLVDSRCIFGSDWPVCKVARAEHKQVWTNMYFQLNTGSFGRRKNMFQAQTAALNLMNLTLATLLNKFTETVVVDFWSLD